MPRDTSLHSPGPTRRHLLRAGLAVPAVAGGSALLVGSATATQERSSSAEVRALERRFHATIGFHAELLGRRSTPVTHRATERAPIHSVFKAYAAAAVLRDLDCRGETLDRLVRYERGDLVTYSPVTEPAVDRGLTVRELCDAAVRISDNTAANLLIEQLSGTARPDPAGPPVLTRFARSIGDRSTRLDRWETELNEARPGDPRDTTTPRELARGIARLLVGDALSRPDRAILRDWMLRNTTSDARFRAGLPPGWRLADKTGSGEKTFNDVGVAWPPQGRPIALAALVRLPTADVEASELIHAELARIAVRRLG